MRIGNQCPGYCGYFNGTIQRFWLNRRMGTAGAEDEGFNLTEFDAPSSDSDPFAAP